MPGALEQARAEVKGLGELLEQSRARERELEEENRRLKAEMEASARLMEKWREGSRIWMPPEKWRELEEWRELEGEVRPLRAQPGGPSAKLEFDAASSLGRPCINPCIQVHAKPSGAPC